MSSVMRRLRRHWTREVVPKPCEMCGTRLAIRVDGVAKCASFGCPNALEPVTYDPSDGSAKGVRG